MLTKEKKIGIYTTVIFHLVALIIFLVVKIHNVVSTDNTFVLDFSGQEQYEARQKQEQAELQATQEIEKMLSGNVPASAARNIAVDRSGGREIRNDKNMGHDKIFDEARDLQNKLDASKKSADKVQTGGTDEVQSGDARENSAAKAYKGPSVLSYSLDGRKGLYLPVPVYKCVGGGDVSVKIVVDRKGYVVEAQIIKSASASDPCICRYAVDAAKRSRFTASSTATAKQTGSIVYRFIAQ
jgi:outer membrane biosynthesis protein TonB